MSKLTDYLKIKKEDLSLVQARIDKDIRHKTAQQMKKDRANGVEVDWQVLVESACKQYLSERKK